jgi:hypothetical protein
MQPLPNMLAEAAVDISIFKAHSVRPASTCAAANASVLIEDIFKMADWSTASKFWQKLYSGEW